MSHTRSDVALFASIAAILLFPIGPLAWIYASRTIRSLDSGDEVGSRERANTARLLAIVATLLLVPTTLLVMSGTSI